MRSGSMSWEFIRGARNPQTFREAGAFSTQRPLDGPRALTQDPTTPHATEDAREEQDALGIVLIAVTLAVVCLITAAWVFALIALGRWLVSALF
jgi:hypothetical protein